MRDYSSGIADEMAIALRNVYAHSDELVYCYGFWTSLTVLRGTESAFAADPKPWPRPKSSIAALLASMSRFTLKSTRIKSLPFLVSKKWEAVH